MVVQGDWTDSQTPPLGREEVLWERGDQQGNDVAHQEGENRENTLRS